MAGDRRQAGGHADGAAFRVSADELSDPACCSLRWSLALIDGLIWGGVRELVLSPGSRSTPLVLAAQRRPDLKLTPVLDERSAAFFALGLARGARRPVALLCTSGSAPAHWFPAVIEAAEWGVPLILLSADRPPELRGWGANQTIDQVNLFGRFVREFHDPGRPLDTPAAMKAQRALGVRAAAVSTGGHPGPVHINLPFDEPLIPGPDCLTGVRAQTTPMPGEHEGLAALHAAPDLPSADRAWHAPLRGRGLICCGPGDHDPALVQALWSCASALHLPVLVDPLSGLRCGHASQARLAHYDSLLRNRSAAAALRPDWVVRLGGSPVSKTLTQWLSGVPAVLLDPRGAWCDPTHDAKIQIGADATHYLSWLSRAEGIVQADPEWLARWWRAEERVAALADEHLAESRWFEGHLLRTLMARLPSQEGLFCANSLPIRQLDTWSGTRDRPLSLFANRGVSGIDGQASTLAGLNAAGRPTWGLLGDLALCHDLSGLLLAGRLDRPLFVLNNGGGRIFDYLPQRHLPGLERLWRTPVPVALGELARPFGIRHRSVESDASAEQTLAEVLATKTPALVEVRIDAERSQQSHERFWRRIAQDRVCEGG